MDQQWQAYSDSRQGRYPHATPQHQSKDMDNGSSQQNHASPAYSYEAYQTPSIPSQSQSMAASPTGTPRARAYSGDGDVAMEDADPYNRLKYPSRPSHQHRTSAPYVPLEDSSAARRYSPMKALSPSMHYPQTPQQSHQGTYSAFNSQNTSARQSPTRSNAFSTPSQNYYPSPGELHNQSQQKCQSVDLYDDAASSRQQPLHLPPIQVGELSPDQFYPSSATAQLNAVFGREAKSPRNPRQPHGLGSSDTARGAVPRFKKLATPKDLEPRVNPQPAFRRASPDGGFISVRQFKGISYVVHCSLPFASPCKH